MMRTEYKQEIKCDSIKWMYKGIIIKMSENKTNSCNTFKPTTQGFEPYVHPFKA